MYAGEETVVNYDLTITGGKVATGTGVRPLTIAIRAGRIAGLLDADENPPASEQIDASGLHILPGVIDTHVHLRDPGTVEREDFITGTSAAAAGGVTTILEMLSSDPPVTTGAILARRAEVVQPRAIVDYALYGAAGHESIEQIPKQAAAGAIAFKTFLTEPAAGQHGYAGLWCSAEALYDVMMAVADTGLRHCFHCENNPMLVAREQRLRAAGRVDGLAHAESRPPMVENSSVAVVLALAAEVGGPVQTVHTTNSLAVANGHRGAGSRGRRHRRNLPAISLPDRRSLASTRIVRQVQSTPAQSRGSRGAVALRRRRADRRAGNGPRTAPPGRHG